MLNNFKTLTFCITLAFCLFIISCKKDSSSPSNPIDPGAGEQETITRIILDFTNSKSVKTSFVINDPDGFNATKSPIIDTIRLEQSMSYNVSLTIYDDTKTPIDTVSSQIKKEGIDHRFHYTFTPDLPTNTSMLRTNISDKDDKGSLLGLFFIAQTTTQVGKGKLNINLRHFATGQTKTDNIKDGETDIFADFPLIVK